MTGRRVTTFVPHTPDEMFALVADVARYPEFLPYCKALRILGDRSAGGVGTIDCEMIVAYRAFRERFKCRVKLDRPAGLIDVDYVEGPFRTLKTNWRFAPHRSGCEIVFDIDFEFRSFLLQATAAAMFERMFEKMSDAFVDRAAEIYGGASAAS